MTHLLHLLVRSGGVKLRAGINGVVLAQDAAGRGFFTRSPLNEWMRPNGNRLDFEVHPVDPPLSDDPPYFEVAVVYPEDDPGPVVRFDWKAARPEPFEPFRVTLPFVLPMDCPSKLWTEAEPFDPKDQKAHDAALAAAKAAYDAFASKKIDRVIDALKYRIEDNARAWLDDPAEDLEGARQAYGAMIDHEQFRLEPWEKMQTRVVADGRAIHVTREGGRPAIASVRVPGVPPGALDVYVAKVGGVWRVVR